MQCEVFTFYSAPVNETRRNGLLVNNRNSWTWFGLFLRDVFYSLLIFALKDKLWTRALIWIAFPLSEISFFSFQNEAMHNGSKWAVGLRDLFIRIHHSTPLAKNHICLKRVSAQCRCFCLFTESQIRSMSKLLDYQPGKAAAVLNFQLHFSGLWFFYWENLLTCMTISQYYISIFLFICCFFFQN